MSSAQTFILLQSKLSELLKEFPPKKIYRDWTVVYSGHYPNVGLVILEGRVLVAGATGPLILPSLIAVDEILQGRPSIHEISVLRDSVVCILDHHQVINLFTLNESNS